MNRFLYHFLLLNIGLSPFLLLGQDTSKKIVAKFITDKINIDGTLDEPVWQNADKKQQI